MSRSLKDFGGWLSFYRLIHWIWFILVLSAYIIFVSLTLFISLMDLSLTEAFVIIPVSILFFGQFFFLSRIFIILEKRSEKVPDKIVRYWLYQLLAQTVVFLILYFSGYLDERIQSVNRTHVLIVGFSGMLLWYIIWIIYFRYSRRVREYYGANAEKLF